MAAASAGFRWGASNRTLQRNLYAALLRSGRDWEREVMRGQPVLCEKEEITALLLELPERVIQRLPGSLSLSGRTLNQLIPIVWRTYGQAAEDAPPQSWPPVVLSSSSSPSDSDQELSNYESTSASTSESTTTIPSDEEALDDALEAIKCIDKRLGALRQLVYTTHSEAAVSGLQITANTVPSLWGSANLFEYKLAITNTDAHKTYQLISRCLTTTDGTGHQQETSEPGVLTKNSAIPKQPYLAPGETVKFSCLAPRVATPYATLKGSYQFIDIGSGEFLDAKIAPLGLHTKQLKPAQSAQGTNDDLRPPSTAKFKPKISDHRSRLRRSSSVRSPRKR